MDKILAGIATASIFTMTACDQGVPKVEDLNNVEVNGQQMTQQTFLDKYCAGKIAEETCMKVTDAMMKEFAQKGPLPHNPD